MSRPRVVYTVITAKYDSLKCPRIVDNNVDYIAYIDAPDHPSVGPWQFVPIKNSQRNPRVTSRWYKVLPHRHLADYQQSLWVDASFELVGSAADFMDRFQKLAPLVTFRHGVRNCAYEEAETVKGVGYDNPHIVDLQMEYYQSLGYPRANGLIESGVILRQHLDPVIQESMEDWWRQIEVFSQRDQLSANFVFWKRQMPFAMLDFNLRSNRWFQFHDHARSDSHVGTESVAEPLNWLRQGAIDARARLQSFNKLAQPLDVKQAELIADRDQLARQFAALVQSRSWRLTEPLRKLRRTVGSSWAAPKPGSD